MGLIFGARLATSHEVVLLDVNQNAIDAVNSEGAKITNKDGSIDVVKNVRATNDPQTIGTADLVVIFTKCYWTEKAVYSALACIGKKTIVLTLQNGWGNYEVISRIVNHDQIMVGVNYVSGTTLAPGHARQVGNPVAFIGRVNAPVDDEVRKIAAVVESAGVKTTPSDTILTEVFKKLALNVATLPTAAILRMEAQMLIENEGTIRAMDDILKEMVAVVTANGVKIQFDERREYIHGLLKNAVGAKGSMLQDVEAKRMTEIDVINGAIVAMGNKCGIPTPVNQTFVNIIKALESTFPA
jgi:2-dehydropantoate 2-reductase